MMGDFIYIAAVAAVVLVMAPTADGTEQNTAEYLASITAIQAPAVAIDQAPDPQSLATRPGNEIKETEPASQWAGDVMSRQQVEQMALQAGWPAHTIPDLLCTVQHESAFNPAAVNINTNGTADTGLLQINDQWRTGYTPTGPRYQHWTPEWLKKPANNLAAGLVVYNERNNFTAWYGWQAHCR